MQFDRAGWLAECSRRLSPEVVEEDESAAVDASYEVRATCEDYLDSYMESARSGAFHAQYSDSGQYMLVPVMVMVPQRAVYREDIAVDR
ncbi:hypothetical protein [Erythrobacter mangrovi]|uniref:Uncharacterized protein n=1 Tax=Erythrobacter mangrovi TaxID=2739433 RepID=A0A7D3XPM6_9SPHN|nr:hypothetical protein [Erythrobacter mangrovi]QKG70914.1 hypothetical protein HQR01_05745 [Erythrobacter mangrovi]